LALSNSIPVTPFLKLNLVPNQNPSDTVPKAQSQFYWSWSEATKLATKLATKVCFIPFGGSIHRSHALLNLEY